jgi:hypothetical protein
LDGDGVDAHPHLGIRLAIVFLDADWFEGCGPLDGPEPVGEGGEAVEVVTRLEVSDVVSQPSGKVVNLVGAVLAVGVGDAVLLIVPATSRSRWR